MKLYDYLEVATVDSNLKIVRYDKNKELVFEGILHEFVLYGESELHKQYKDYQVVGISAISKDNLLIEIVDTNW